ncbi:hypothetical protein LSH36_1460g00028 [Paralvinella palmiformis]|uniref:Uncharacterized protein n=1 Tax=Paralvinella palmiformis TaxID=53620 RepID=A0AAD9MRA6_9ANNE|nr:hypothetical protein LSH36_1460g00028 [Paralvinella palmiformis]
MDLSSCESDIDGDSLAGRHPNKLTKQKLKFWLDCKSISHKKLKTKAELVTRVLEVSRTDVVVVDPTPDLLYTKRKSESSSKHTADCEQSKNGETADVESISQPTSGWHKVIPPGISFNNIYINDYVLNSGKRAFKMDSDQPRKKTCILSRD